MDFELVCVILYLVVGICTTAYALFQVQYRAAQQAGKKVQKLQAELESLQRDGTLVDNTAQTRIADLSNRVRYLSTPRWKFELDKAALIVWLWPFFVVHLVWTLFPSRPLSKFRFPPVRCSEISPVEQVQVIRHFCI